MDRYIVVSKHTDMDCVKALKAVESIGYITHFEWGCKDGDHTGYVIIEADSHDEAKMVVPSYERPNATVVKLNKFSVDDVRQMKDH